MSEAELLDLTSNAWGNAISLTAIFVAIFSSYLITAHVAVRNSSARWSTRPGEISNGFYE